MFVIQQDKKTGYFAIHDSSEYGWQEMEPISEYFLTYNEAIQQVMTLNREKMDGR